MKNLFLSIGLSIPLVFCGGNYIHAQEVSEHTKKSERSLPDYTHVLVKLSSDIDIYLVTSMNGSHINILAEKLGISPIMPDKKYSRYRVAFPPNNQKLKQMAKELDKNDNKIIDLDELSEIY